MKPEVEIKIIKISNRDYKYQFSLKAMMLYEEITGHSIAQTETLKERVQLFYCCVNVLNPEISYDNFVNLIDKEPFKVGEFINSIFEFSEKKQKTR
jgi:hypothetical protein